MRNVRYLAHPVRGATREEVVANLDNVKAWLRWLFVHDPETVYIAPWVAEVEAFMATGQDADQSIMAKALRDDRVVVAMCDGLLLVGGRISSGMQEEMDAALAGGNDVIDWSTYRSPAEVPEGRVP
jgi:hypothetical protein